MKKFIFIVITLLILGSIWFWWVNKPETLEFSDNEYNIPIQEEVKLIAFDFVNNFSKLLVDSSDNEKQEIIYNALSVRVKEDISREDLFNEIVNFVGVQEVPDQGLNVKDCNVDDEKVVVSIELNYSESLILLNIDLIKEDDQWKIDAVNKEEIESYNQIGNLVCNNPGMTEGVWSLVYDEPGAPGQSVQLSFLDSSTCGGVLCQDILTSDIQGSRVEVKGYNKEGIEVESLTFFNIEDTMYSIARSWIVNNSPTFLFDGEDLEFQEVRGLDLVDCENCYEVDFSFQSRHAGYGNREEEALAQVITFHNITVFIEDNLVTRVVTDGVFDEKNSRLINI